MIGLGVFLLILLIGFGVTTWQNNQEAAQLEATSDQKALVFEAAAMDQIDLGNYESAISILDKVIEQTTERSEPYYYRAVSSLGARPV